MFYGKVTRYTHYFAVIAYEPKLRLALREYMGMFEEKELRRIQGRFRNVPKRMWCRRSLRNGVRAFSINDWPNFIKVLDQYGLSESDLEITTVEPNEGKSVPLKVRDGYTPWDDQIPLVKHGKEIGPQYAVTLQPGGGKASVLSAPIKVPGGWSTMGEMYVGKTITRRDGGKQQVTGVFPQGVTKVRRVHFADGRYTDVNPEHLWEIRIRSNERSRVVDTNEIQRLLDLNNDMSKRITVPLCQPEDSPDLDLPIHPYILGVILGDGHISKNYVTITKKDEFVFDRIRRLLPAELELSGKLSEETGVYTYRIITSEYGRKHGLNNTLIRDLRAMGLDNRKANDKFIPPDYLNGSIEQRYDLLQGLMDTDGTVDYKSTLSYSSVSSDLAKDVQYLARSLGGIASLSTRIPKYSYKGVLLEGQVDNRVFLRMPVPRDVFSLPRKKRLARNNQYTDELRLRIVRIEERPDEETQCITVDSEDHLYITDDFIVTHNTAIAMFLAEFFGKRFAVITKGGYEGRWVPAFYEYLELTPDEVRSCCGAKAIANLIKEAKKHGIDQVKAIFISTGGFRDYIKKYEDGHYDGTHCEDVPPEKLLDFLEVGFRITDEAHQDIHLNFLVDLYTNMKRTLYLTGTLYPTVEFMRRIYEMYLPLEIRKTTKFKVYAEAVEVFYYLNDPDSAKYTDSQGSYNHIIFEQWLMKDEKRLKNWLDAYYDYVVATWASNRVEETKIITFAATIELNGKMAEYFKKRMPDMRVVQYKAGDPYDYLIDNDMIFATLGKAGTAVDIPDLEQVNMTHAVDAPNTFVQAFGRLRELKKYPKLTPSFHWFTCGNIDKQREYGDRKRKVLRPRVKGFRTAYLNKKI